MFYSNPLNIVPRRKGFLQDHPVTARVGEPLWKALYVEDAAMLAYPNDPAPAPVAGTGRRAISISCDCDPCKRAISVAFGREKYLLCGGLQRKNLSAAALHMVISSTRRKQDT
jgi:hypothetical protein